MAPVQLTAATTAREQTAGAAQVGRSTQSRWLLFASLTAIALTALAAQRAGYPDFSLPHVVFWWVSSMVLALAAAMTVPVPGAEKGWRGISLPSPQAAFAWIGMALLAGIPRLVMPDRFPSFLDGDEGSFVMHAVQYRAGEMTNPFQTGFTSHPVLYMALESIVADLFGAGVGAHRVLSGLLGTIGVLAAWRLGMRLVGPFAGTLGAALLVAWPLHLYFSRNAMNNITDPTFLTLGLLFVLIALDERRPLAAMLAGLALGCGLYGYYGGRALLVVVLVVLAAAGIERRSGLRAIGAVVGWVILGFLSITTPLLMTFRRNPGEFGGHLDLVSPISLTTMREDPAEVIPMYLENLWDAFVFPVAGTGAGFFRHDRPFIGWQLTILLAAGLVVMLVQAVRWREFRVPVALVLPYLMLVAGIALAIPISSQRYNAVMPLLAIVCGVGLRGLVDLARLAFPRVGTLFPVLLGASVVAGVNLHNLTWYASEDRQIENHGEHRTIAMWDIGWRLNEGKGSSDPRVRLLLAGPPFIFADSFANLRFLSQGVPREEVALPMVTADDVPALPAGTVLVLIPERALERCAVEAAHPNATVMEARSRDGQLLYIAFYRGELAGWSLEETPAETTLSEVGESPCGSGT